MRLGLLLADSDVKVTRDLADLDIENATLDSRKCRANTLFIAAKGASADSRDGEAFVDDAIAHGACAIVSERQLRTHVPVLISKNARAVAAACAEALAGHPSRKLKVFGVTGTNGKTSVTFFLASILKSAGFKSSVVGTLGIGDINNLQYTGFTTPEAEALSQALADLRNQGVSHVAMEVSSHALALSRCDAIAFSAAAFLNLSEDHLDFHESMDSYRKAKERLFLELLPADAPCIVPEGDPLETKLRELGRKVFSFGTTASSDLGIEEAHTTQTGTQVRLRLCGQIGIINIPVFGAFNLDNVMVAAGLAFAGGVSTQAIFAALSRIQPPPGRLEPLAVQKKPLVFIDFAHTPDALQKALGTIRTFTKGSLKLVFGCGGDRDRQKRPLMGAIAATTADEIWMTNDNPRHESPKQIFDDISAGIEPFMRGKFKIIPDRAKAISEAIDSAQLEDIVLIAGKGHETTLQIGNTFLPFSDKSVAKEALEKWQK